MADSLGTIRFIKRPPAPGDVLEHHIKEEGQMSLSSVKDGRPTKVDTNSTKTTVKREEVVEVSLGAVEALKIKLTTATATIQTKGDAQTVADPLLGFEVVVRRLPSGKINVTLADGSPLILSLENQLRTRYEKSLEKFGAFQRALPDVDLHVGDRMDSVAKAITGAFSTFTPHGELTGSQATLVSIAHEGTERIGVIEFKISLTEVGTPSVVHIAVTGTMRVRARDSAALELKVDAAIRMVDSRRPNRAGLQATNGKGSMKSRATFRNTP